MTIVQILIPWISKFQLLVPSDTRASTLNVMTREQLLVLCATAVEKKNVTLAQQAVSALERMSSCDGEPRERVTAYFLQALVRRAGTLLDPSLLINVDHPRSYEVRWTDSRELSLNELTSFVDKTPYYRFGYTAANGALLKAFQGSNQVHIVDFSTTHCMQWPTLIAALADRMEGPPHVRLTVSSASPPTPPRLKTTYEDLGSRLTAFARLKGVPFEFYILPQPLESLKASDIDLRDSERLGVNCALRLHYIPDETAGSGQYSESSNGGVYPLEQLHISGPPCPRDKFLEMIRGLNPAIVTVFEENCNTTSPDIVSRLMESYSYEWIPFDILATTFQPGDELRIEFEKNVGRKIENIVSCEGLHRIERSESQAQWLRRMRRLQFRIVALSDDVADALEEVLGDHASGWGMKLDGGDTQLLFWKGHTVAFASAWIPDPPLVSHTN